MNQDNDTMQKATEETVQNNAEAAAAEAPAAGDVVNVSGSGNDVTNTEETEAEPATEDKAANEAPAEEAAVADDSTEAA